MIEKLNPPRRWFGYGLIALTVLITYALWIGSLWQAGAWYDSWLVYPAKVGSHGTLLLMCWAFILATRFRPVEWLFGGLDKVYQAHRYVGEAAFFLIFLHPVFLAFAFSEDVGSFFRYLWFSSDWVRNTGLIALLAFILLVVLSIYVKIAYHQWKRTHDFFGLLLVFIVVHAVISGGEIMKFPVLTVWHGAWVTAGLSAYLYIRILYRFIGPQYDYVTDSVKQRKDAITDIHLTPVGRALDYAPGQFIYISFNADAVSEEPHPFSISSSPESSTLRLSIKRLGDWTQSVDQIKAGEKARIWGPYGHFSDGFFEHPELPAVLIGGGIGITPFLSILSSRAMVEREGKTLLIYSTPEAAKSVYDEEISAACEALPQVNYQPHHSDDEGFIDRPYLEGLLDQPFQRYLWLVCGPTPLMTALEDLLTSAGVPSRQIIMEQFNIR